MVFGKGKQKEPWNKGRTKSEDKRLDYSRPTIFKKGVAPKGSVLFGKGQKTADNRSKTPWNKGKNYHLKNYNHDSAKNSPFIKGHKPFTEKGRFSVGSKGHEGHKHSESTKLVMRLKKLKETTPLRLQVRSTSKYKEWTICVFQRDNWTCKACNIRGGVLHAHHIKFYSEIFKKNDIKTFDEAITCQELWDTNNGVTLCEECHDRLHKKIKEK